MKKRLNVLLYPACMLLVWGNLFFFRPQAMIDLPSIAWVLITLFCGSRLGMVLNILLKKGSPGTPSLWRWHFLSGLAVFWILFGMAGIFYTPVIPTPFVRQPSRSFQLGPPSSQPRIQKISEALTRLLSNACEGVK